jgi:hypothetical protein
LNFSSKKQEVISSKEVMQRHIQQWQISKYLKRLTKQVVSQANQRYFKNS